MDITRCQQPFSTTPLGEKILHEINRGNFDQVDSGTQYFTRYQRDLDKEEHLYIVLGTDSGLFPEWVAKRGIPSSSRFIFLEIPEVIDCVRERLGDLVDDKQLFLSTVDDWMTVARQIDLDGYLFKDQFITLRSFAALDKSHPSYITLDQTYVSEIRAHRHRLRAELENAYYVEVQLENAADNLWPLSRLKQAFEGWDAVLLAGGPSLDNLLPWIIENRDRLLVIAVSRISRQLNAMGLAPDIVVSIDPQPISFDISKEMLNFPAETIFINAYHVATTLLGQWHGQAYFCGDKYPWDTPLNDVNNLPVNGPTVTNTGLMAAVYLGCRKVVLAGVDLCFSKEGHTHASGSNERQTATRTAWQNQVETNDGTIADTSPDFALAIKIMGEQAGLARDLKCEIINPALTAAKIDNVVYRPLSDIALDEERPRPLDVVRSKTPANDKPARLKIAKSTVAELAQANKGLRAIQKLTSEALECNERLRAGPSPQHKQRMDKIERTLDKKLHAFSMAVKRYAAPQFLRLSRPDPERAWTDEELLDWGHDYYQTYHDATQRLFEFVEIAQKKAATRLAELSDHPDMDTILDAWDEDNTPGRARIWQDNPEAPPLEPTIQQRLEAMRQRFDEMLAKTETEHGQHLAQHAELDLAQTVNRLRILFQKQDTAELNRIADTLQDSDKIAAAHLQELARGYVAELGGDRETAYGHYNKVVDAAAALMDDDGLPDDKRTLEEALKRMSIIALDRRDTEGALAILDTLSAVSAIHTPQFAEMLALTGRFQDAVNVYTQYLEQHPGDLQTMLKLGKLFQRAGIDESARWACEYVLEKDPGNLVALQMLNSLSG